MWKKERKEMKPRDTSGSQLRRTFSAKERERQEIPSERNVKKE